MRKKENVVNLLLTVTFAILFIILTGWYFDLVYATNDDIFIGEILSGGITGTPEWRTIYLGISAGILVSTLYRVFPGVAWYGVFLCAGQLIALMVVLYRSLQMVTGKRKGVVLALFVMFASGVSALHFANIQYTVTAGMVGSAAIFLFYTTDEKQGTASFLKQNIPTFFLLFLAGSIRQQVIWMLLPIAGLFWLQKWFTAKKQLVCFLLAAAFTVSLLVVIERVSYADTEWRTFLDYTDSREKIMDYYGYPDYEEYKTLYEELGISHAAYVGASTRYDVLTEPNINASSMKELAGVSKTEWLEKQSIPERIKDAAAAFLKRNLNYVDRPLNLFIYAAYLFVALAAVLQKKYRVLSAELLLLAGRMVSWCYLLYTGRYPTRVTQALYYAELFSLTAIFLTYRLYEQKKKWFQVIALGCFLFLTVWCGYRKAITVRAENAAMIASGKELEQLKAYCAEHEENLYLFDMKSVEHYMQGILAKPTHAGDNYVVLGGWLPKSPLYDEKIEQYGVTDIQTAVLTQKNVYFVCNGGATFLPAYFYEYYKEKYPEYELGEVDRIVTFSGLVFQVIGVVDDTENENRTEEK